MVFPLALEGLTGESMESVTAFLPWQEGANYWPNPSIND